MARTASARSAGSYRPTEAKYKGGAEARYVTYDLPQPTRGGGTATYPKVKRVYVAGDVSDWKVGTFRKRSGREVRGVKIAYEQSRAGYERRSYTAKRGETSYKVKPAAIGPSVSHFSQVVEVPAEARNVRYHDRELPERYRAAVQDVR